MFMVRNAMSNTPLFLRVVCLYVIAALPIWAISHFTQPSPLVASVQFPPVSTLTTQTIKKQVISGQPARINITRLGIDLPVVDGVYDAQNDSWTLRDDAVQFATITTLPNDVQGNTFLYGHNTVQVLEPVKNIVPGDVLTITTTNGKVFSYAYVSDLSVTPDRTDVLAATSPTPRVTLMTCQGFFSETRRLLYFDFTGVA